MYVCYIYAYNRYINRPLFFLVFFWSVANHTYIYKILWLSPFHQRRTFFTFFIAVLAFFLNMRDTAAREGRHGVTGFGNESIQFSKKYIYIYIPGPPPTFFLYIEVFVEVLRRIEQQQPFPFFWGGVGPSLANPSYRPPQLP